MLRIDALHGRAHAHGRRHELDDGAARFFFFGQAVDQIQLGAHQPARAIGAGLDGLDDVLGRADIVGVLAHLEVALGVGDDEAVRMLHAPAADVALLEHLVHRAVAFPQQDARLLDLLGGEAAVFLVRVPDHHFVERDVLLVAGPAAEVLVGEEQHLLALLERPVENGRRVGRGAHDAAVLATEGFEVGRRVDVGDRGDVLVGVAQHFGQLAPAALDLGEIGHVGHRTAGSEVGQDGDLLVAGQDVGHFGHEVHAAKHDVFGAGLGGQLGELERVAGQVGVLIDVGTLVVMA